MRPNNYSFSEKIDGKYGISTCCSFCKAPFVDIAHVQKAATSNTVYVKFNCNKCGKENDIEYNQKW